MDAKVTSTWARVAIVTVVLGGCAPGCFLLAPPPSTGLSSGSACGADLDCQSGLSCECGVCASPGSLPVACNVELENECGDTPSICYAECGDRTEVGTSVCIDLREVCEDGVREIDCPAATCWGEPAPGEICDNGTFICQFDTYPTLDACQTFDCVGEAEACVEACDSEILTDQVCAAGTWQCRTGVAQNSCGPCIAPVPLCFDGCDTLNPLQAATCNEDTGWVCPAGAESEAVCCPNAGGTYFTPDDLGERIDETCLRGAINLYGDFSTVDFPNLRRAETINIWDADVTLVRAPELREVTGNLSFWNNDLLMTIEVPALASVGGLLEINSNPVLPTCLADDIVAQVLSRGGAGNVLNQDNGEGSCGLDGGVLDAGLSDSGPAEDGGDSGPLDAGSVDAAQADAADGGD